MVVDSCPDIELGISPSDGDKEGGDVFGHVVIADQQVGHHESGPGLMVGMVTAPQ